MKFKIKIRVLQMSEKQRFQEALDDYMNLLVNKPTANAISQLETNLKNRGISNKQIEQIKGRCMALGLTITEKRERIVLQVGEKYSNMDTDIQLKDVLNQFGETIYGKKFNDGIFGAFGQAQNVLPENKGKLIILQLPKVFQHFDAHINYSSMCSVCELCMTMTREDPRNKLKILWQKMQNSIKHVTNHDVQVKIEYV